jgi:hypothetical protein
MQPLTTAEMTEYWRADADQPNVTELWVAALKPFDAPEYSPNTAELPVLPSQKTPADAPEVMSEQQHSKVRAFVEQHQATLAGLYAAAHEQGTVRYDRDFRLGIILPLPECDQAMKAQTLARNEFYLLVQGNKFDAAIDNLEMRSSLRDTFRDEVALVVLQIRVKQAQTILEDMQWFLRSKKLTFEQHFRLLHLLRTTDLTGQLATCTIGERALLFHAFVHQEQILNVDPETVNREKLVTERLPASVSRAADCAMAMDIMQEIHAATELPLPEALLALHSVKQRLKTLEQADSQGHWSTKRRYVFTVKMIPAFLHVASTAAKTEVQIDLLHISIAAQLYTRNHVTLPNALDDMMPAFLPHALRDPFSGKPYRYQTNDGEALVYSFGQDFFDNGGVCDPVTMTPDIAVQISRPSAD